MAKLSTGAEIVFKCLEDQNVEFIFGYPGGAVLPIYDELKNHFHQSFFSFFQTIYIKKSSYISSPRMLSKIYAHHLDLFLI